MPCKDSSSLMKIWIDSKDRLLDFDFSKITCGKDISGQKSLKEFILGVNISKILNLEFPQVIDQVQPANTEDEFFLYLEWLGLLSGLSQYMGEVSESELTRYTIASIEQDEKGTLIQILAVPPENLPKIESCFKRSQRLES